MPRLGVALFTFALAATATVTLLVKPDQQLLILPVGHAVDVPQTNLTLTYEGPTRVMYADERGCRPMIFYSLENEADTSKNVVLTQIEGAKIGPWTAEIVADEWWLFHSGSFDRDEGMVVNLTRSETTVERPMHP